MAVVHECPVGVHDVDDPRDVTGEAGGVGTEERLEEETVRAPRAAWVALSVPSPTKAERMPPKDVTGMEKGSVRVEEWEAEKDESTTQSYVLAKRLSPERTQW